MNALDDYKAKASKKAKEDARQLNAAENIGAALEKAGINETTLPLRSLAIVKVGEITKKQKTLFSSLESGFRHRYKNSGIQAARHPG
jgi:hypothetical protein